MKKEKNYQKEILQILSEEFSTKVITISIIIGIVLLPILFVLGSKFGSTPNIYLILGILSFIDVIVISYLFRIKKKNTIAKQKLNDAFDNSRVNNVKSTVENLVEAYQNVKNSRLLEFIFIYATQHRPGFDQQSIIVSLELNKLKTQNSKDKQLVEILKHILETTENIGRHKKFISKSNLKIKKLQDEINQTDEKELLAEYGVIIQRYEGIVEKGMEKLEKDEQKVENLLKLKHNFIITKKIKQAREELKQMEDEFWVDSISEEYYSNYNENKISSFKAGVKKEEDSQRIFKNYKLQKEKRNLKTVDEPEAV